MLTRLYYSQQLETAFHKFCDIPLHITFKATKSDGDIGLSSDHFKHSFDDLAVYISLLFAAWLVHSTAPSKLFTSTVTPNDLILPTVPTTGALHGARSTANCLI